MQVGKRIKITAIVPGHVLTLDCWCKKAITKCVAAPTQIQILVRMHK